MNSVFDNADLKDPEVKQLLDQAVHKLKHARLYRQRTQSQIAKKAGLSQKAVSLIESGKNTTFQFDTYIKLCLALRLRPSVTLKPERTEPLTYNEKWKQWQVREKANKGLTLDEDEKELL